MKSNSLALIIALPLLAGCAKMADCTDGNGAVTTANRSTSEFSAVVVNGSFEVILQRGTASAIRIEADSNLHKQILSEVKGEELRLSTEGCVEPSKPIRIFVTAPIYQSLEVNGSGSISSEELISTENELELVVDGSGKITLDVHAETINAELDGSGTITLKGGAQGQKVNLDGSGDYLATDLIVQETMVNLSGSGSADVNTRAALTADISGSGNVRYKGSPQKIDSDVSGSGQLIQQ